MNNPIYIAFDDADSLLGHFFQGCADYIHRTLFKKECHMNLLTRRV